MLYKLRRHDGSASPFSAGTFVDARGETTPLGWDDVKLQVLSTWESPRGGARYPSRWRLEIGGALTEIAGAPPEIRGAIPEIPGVIPEIPGYVLEIHPYVADQEWPHSVRYWEGAVEVRGSTSSGDITGDGYVELTGYASKDAPSAHPIDSRLFSN
jgi:predicted secreted hydrolase